METKKSKIRNLEKALQSYKQMLNSKDYAFMHDVAREKIKEISEELEVLKNE